MTIALESIPSGAKEICYALSLRGHEAWLVGGAVRDALMGRTPCDWDIATNAKPEFVAKLFPRVIPTGIKHGTVTVLMPDGKYEVTTFRGDGAYEDGRRPTEVRFLDSIEEDLARRDFTMNAIAFDPIHEVTMDPFEGRNDIELKRIKAVGQPLARFAEDGLRILRAARFAATLGFEIEKRTKNAMRHSIPTYRKVAMERVCAEWTKALLALSPSIALEIMAETDIIEATLPEMVPMFGCTQNRWHAYDVWNHTMAVLDATPAELSVRLAALFHDIAKPATKAVHPVTGDATFYDHEEVGAGVTDALLERLRFSTDVRRDAVHLVRHHLVRYESGWAASAIRRWVRRVGPDAVGPLLALARADIVGKGPAVEEMKAGVLDELEHRIATMTISAPIVTNTSALAISGNDVMTILGIPPGPRVGTELKRLLELVTDDPTLNERETLLGLLKGTP